MSYPFGGINLGVVRQALVNHCGIKELLTNHPVDTLDGPGPQPFWHNPKNNKTAEVPSGAEDDRMSVERAQQITRRLGVSYDKFLGHCMEIDNPISP